MAKYVMQEMPKLMGDGKGIKYPKMKLIGQCSHRDIVGDIVGSTSFTRGDVEGLITALSEAIARRVAYGYSVKVEGLGCFKAKLGLRPGVEREGQDSKRRNATSIEIAGINYIGDKGLLALSNKYCHLEREQIQSYTAPRTKQTERLEQVRTYLAEHRFIKVRAYAALTGLSPSSASKELRKFYEQGKLGAVGAGTHRLYTLVEPLD